MKVYVVTSGVYSDFQIEAIFSSKEKAQQYLKDAAQTGYGQGYSELNEEIEEYTLDECFVDLSKTNTYKCQFDPKSQKIEVEVSFASDIQYTDKLEIGWMGKLNFYVKAKTLEAAKKIAREKAAIYKESYFLSKQTTKPK